MSRKLVISDKKNVAIVYRPDVVKALTLAKAITKWLRERDYQVFTAPEQKLIQGTKAMRASREFDKVALVIVLGGDGTYLRAIRLLQGRAVPILGVNLGSLGFLTPTRAEEMFTAVESALENKMELRPRSTIEVQLLRKGKKKFEGLALNDIVIERGSLSQLINLAIRCDRKLVSEIKADGLIVASPTGSTAYNLAAGGPILHPDVKALVVTPISAHSLTSRPIIFPDDSKLSIKLIGKSELNKDRAHFVVDGMKIDQLSGDDELILKRSSMDHLMVRDPNQNDFLLMREKLKFGDR